MIYEYKGLKGIKSKCGLEIRKGTGKWAGSDVVIMEELPQNKGTSITNCAESLLAKIQEDFTLDKPVFLEYYRSSGYSRVQIKDGKPDWKFVPVTEVRKNICEVQKKSEQTLTD